MITFKNNENIRQSKVIALCYSISDPSSVDYVFDMYLECQRIFDSDIVPCFLIQTQSDLMNEVEFDYDRIRNFSKKIGVDIIETSSKTRHNIDQVFEKSIDIYIKHYPNEPVQLQRGCCIV